MTKEQELRPIQGKDLKTRWEASLKNARSFQPQSPVWIGYSFGVRHGVGVEIVPEAGIENRNLGLFFLCDPAADSIKKFEVHNLDRKRHYDHPGYWLDQAETNASLNLLKELIRNKTGDPMASRLIEAISMHDGTEADSVLEEIAQQSSVKTERTIASYWLRERATARQPFKDLPDNVAALTEIVRNDRESLTVRRKAAIALGLGADPAGLRALAALYPAAKEAEVKNLILGGAVNKVNDISVGLFLDVAATETDARLRRQAFSWLAEKTGNRIAWNVEPGLRLFANDQISDDEQAKLNEISRRAPAEAVSELIRIAETDPKIGIRKAAVVQLGQLGDERALQFFRKILTEELKGRPASAA